MIWYIITIASLICGTISRIVTLPDNFGLALFVIAGIFFIISFIVTLYCINCQKDDYISLGQRQKAINILFANLKILKEEYAIKEEKVLKHEISIINCLGMPLKNEIDSSGDNVLSHNLLAQIPELNAINNINNLYSTIKQAREYIINEIKYYNNDVTDIKRRQENTLICTPFIPRYNVSYYEDVTFLEI